MRACELRWSASLPLHGCCLGAPQTFYARMQLLRLAWALTGAAICCFLIFLIHSRLLKEGNRSHASHVTFTLFECGVKFPATIFPMRSVSTKYRLFLLLFFVVFLSRCKIKNKNKNPVKTPLKQISLHEAELVLLSFDISHLQFSLSTSHSPVCMHD